MFPTFSMNILCLPLAVVRSLLSFSMVVKKSVQLLEAEGYKEFEFNELNGAPIPGVSPLFFLVHNEEYPFSITC